MRDIIRRKYYFERIKPFIDNNIIKVIVGQRRSGKSYFLFQIINELDSNDVNIIYINKELYEFHFINDYTDLLDHINTNVDNGKKNKIFIDEIQDIKDFEKALRSLQAEEKYDIYITGSNANLLSGELATYLSGRYIQINIYPLTYSEFLEFHNLNNSNESFSKYIRYGGLPYIKNLQLSDEIVFDYLHNIYQSILLKDVVARNQIRNIAFLEDLSNYVADNIGNLISAKKISDYLKSQKIQISPRVVLTYLKYLQNAFLVYKLNRVDVNSKKSLK